MAKQLLCTVCGFQGKPKIATKGHFLIEVVLWCALIVPGLVYSLWRQGSKHPTCPECGNQNMIPISSPVAKKFLAEHQKT